MSEYESCDCGRGEYDPHEYSTCYECYLDRRAQYNSCIFCGRWHSPRYETCFQCRSQGREDAGRQLRALILYRDFGECQECRATGGFAPHIDHIVPCVKRGNAEEWNLRTLCSDCNHRKGETWWNGCMHEHVKTSLVRRYFLIQAVYFTPETRARFRREVALWRRTGTWDPLVHLITERDEQGEWSS